MHDNLFRPRSLARSLGRLASIGTPRIGAAQLLFGGESSFEALCVRQRQRQPSSPNSASSKRVSRSEEAAPSIPLASDCSRALTRPGTMAAKFLLAAKAPLAVFVSAPPAAKAASSLPSLSLSISLDLASAS